MTNPLVIHPLDEPLTDLPAQGTVQVYVDANGEVVQRGASGEPAKMLNETSVIDGGTPEE